VNLVFGRKHARRMHNHRQEFMSEFGEGVDAFRRAAGHLAQGTAERLSPTYDRARHLAGRGLESTRQGMSPMYQQLRENAMGRSIRHQKKEIAKRGRRRMLRGLLVTGAAIGAASAAVARRRRQQAEWAEYEPTAGFDESRYAESKYGQRSATQKVAAGAATMADSLSDRAGRLADSLHERSSGMPETTGGQHHDTGPMGPSAGQREQSGPGMSGQGMAGPPGSMAGPGPRSQAPMSTSRERLGDPALDFPDER
jgi:hypothetical protein